MTRDPSAPGNLSIHRSFVLSLDGTFDATARRIGGRIEHVLTGEATQFHSFEELLSFLDSNLRPERRRGGSRDEDCHDDR